MIMKSSLISGSFSNPSKPLSIFFCCTLKGKIKKILHMHLNMFTIHTCSILQTFLTILRFCWTEITTFYLPYMGSLYSWYTFSVLTLALFLICFCVNCHPQTTIPGSAWPHDAANTALDIWTMKSTC